MDPIDTPATASVVIPVASVSPNPAALAKLSAELAGAEEAHIAPDPVPIGMAHEDATRSTTASKVEPSAQPVERPLSPQIAREILQATSKAPRRRPSRRVILLGVIALIGIAANGFFFFGFFDKFLGIPEPLYVPPPALDRSAVETAPPSVPVVTEAVATAPVSSALPTENPKAHEKPGKTAASTAPSSNRPVAETQTPTSEAKPVLLTERTGTPARIFTPKPVTTSALDSAYLLLTQGRLDEASTLYQQALAKNSAEIDALIGLAYVAQHQGRRDDARSFYQRVLRQQPNHPAAMAGVLEANAEGNPQASASRARELAERNPESAVALSTLGGMLAREGRIAEAQQAYFKAYTLEPTSGFHAFNLAVALDRLHKYAQAQQYYERALELAKAMPPGDQTHFPQAAATQRLEQLRGEGNGPLRDH
jgi:Flp pilus assembly protein TadD